MENYTQSNFRIPVDVSCAEDVRRDSSRQSGGLTHEIAYDESCANYRNPVGDEKPSEQGIGCGSPPFPKRMDMDGDDHWSPLALATRTRGLLENIQFAIATATTEVHVMNNI